MNKKNLVLGGILVILVIIAYVYQGPFKEWRTSLGKSKNFLANAQIDQIDQIEITKNGELTTLEKSGDTSAGSAQVKWKIGGTKEFYVQDSLASNMVDQLKQAAESEIELVSANKDKKVEFQTDNSGIEIKLMQGETVIADFIVGKMASDYASTYISEPDSDKTYSVKANLAGVFARSDWYDKTIFSTGEELIDKIRFQYPGREFTIEKQATSTEDKIGKWAGTLPYNFSVDKEKITEILNIMSNLQASEIPDQTFKGTGLEKNLIIVQATGKGIDNTIMVGDPRVSETSGESSLYYAKKANSDNIYLITKEQRDELDKRISDLR